MQFKRIFNPRDIVLCPYNPVHQLYRGQLAEHLIGCRITCSNGQQSRVMKTCPFDSIHVMDEREFLIHLTICESRKYHDNERARLRMPHGTNRCEDFDCKCGIKNWEKLKYATQHKSQETRIRALMKFLLADSSKIEE